MTNYNQFGPLNGGARRLTKQHDRTYKNGMSVVAKYFSGSDGRDAFYINVYLNPQAKYYFEEALKNDRIYNIFVEKFTDDELHKIKCEVYYPDKCYFLWEDLETMMKDLEHEDPVKYIDNVVKKYMDQLDK